MRTCACGNPSLPERKACKACRNASLRARYKSDPSFRATKIRDAHIWYDPEKKKERYYQLQEQAFGVLGGPVCSACSFTDKRALQIDHVAGGGNRLRQETHEYGLTLFRRVLAAHGAGYQILCANCNLIKKVERGEQGGRPRTRSATPLPEP